MMKHSPNVAHPMWPELQNYAEANTWQRDNILDHSRCGLVFIVKLSDAKL